MNDTTIHAARQTSAYFGFREALELPFYPTRAAALADAFLQVAAIGAKDGAIDAAALVAALVADTVVTEAEAARYRAA